MVVPSPVVLLPPVSLRGPARPCAWQLWDYGLVATMAPPSAMNHPARPGGVGATMGPGERTEGLQRLIARSSFDLSPFTPSQISINALPPVVPSPYSSPCFLLRTLKDPGKLRVCALLLPAKSPHPVILLHCVDCGESTPPTAHVPCAGRVLPRQNNPILLPDRRLDGEPLI